MHHTSKPAGTSARRSAHVLSQPTGVTLLGREIKAEIYLDNGFRFLPAPADASRNDIYSLGGSIQNRRKLNSKYDAADRAIRLGYGHDHEIDPAAAASALTDPRRRIVAELFWLHVDPASITTLQATPSLAELHPTEGIMAPWKLAAAASDANGLRAAHAIAVCLHNRAIARELVLFERASTPDSMVPREEWQAALDAWATVLTQEQFWGYIAQRMKESDHVSLRPPSVMAEIRHRLPLAVLGFHGALARVHALEGRLAMALAHLALVRTSGFPADSVTQAQKTIATEVAKTLLGNLTRLAAAGAGNARPRQQWATVLEPVLVDAEKLMKELGAAIGAGVDVSDQGWCDEFCLAFLQAINSGIDYSVGENKSNILFGMLMIRRLLALPISAAVRHRLESQIRTDTVTLFKPQIAPSGVNPTDCWFAPGNPADADVSVIESMHKVTRETPFNLEWSKARVLIPRSRLAEAFHRTGHWNSRPVTGAAPSASGTGTSTSVAGGGSLLSRLWKSVFGGQPAPSVSPGALPAPTPSPAPPKPKPLGDRMKFPVVQRALSDGFKVGEKPVERDMSGEIRRMLAGMSYAERQALSGLPTEMQMKYLQHLWDKAHPS